MTDSLLIVFGGLPGTGKTTLAQALSSLLKSVYLRIDTIEQTLLRAQSIKEGHEGYLIAYALAEDNLRRGNRVIADSVNSIPVTRNSWRDIAQRTGSRLIEIEIVCSDSKEHRRRIESHKADIEGHKMPTWEEVVNCGYHPWATRNFTVDTSCPTIDEGFEDLVQQLDFEPPSTPSVALFA
ncbi:MAG: adenylylsulfate kinase [Alphaproteobacteria bacterium]|nr:adenylylsulfate kinase [Alphaproteobacteria bacterium]